MASSPADDKGKHFASEQPGAGGQDVAIDPNYVQHWASSHRVLVDQLEPEDICRVKKMCNSRDVRQSLETQLQNSGMDELRHSAALIVASLEHFERLSDYIEQYIGKQDALRNQWGLFFILVELNLESPYATANIAAMMKRTGQKLELFNEHCKSGRAAKQTKEAALDVHLELAEFFVHAIQLLRDKYHVLLVPSNKRAMESEWKVLLDKYHERLRNIDDIFFRIERMTQLAKMNDMKERFQGLQSLLSLSSSTGAAEEATLPCIIIPPVKTSRSYDRVELLASIDAFFGSKLKGEAREFRSLALYGIGGVGKSHVAFQYCQTKAKAREFDAIIWIFSETATSLEYSFTAAALQLKLPNVDKTTHTENRIILKTWLQKTDCSWLMVFDNAEDPDLLLEYWPPACAHGSILLTSRNPNMRYGPVDDGIEVESFSPDHGCKLLLHLLRLDVIKDLSNNEVESAMELSERLSGHALAINHLAGIVQKRSWTIDELLDFYNRKAEMIHGLHRPNALSAIWQLSFSSLNKESSSLLGLLSFLSPDEVAEDTLTNVQLQNLTPEFQECLEESEFHVALESLLTLMLVKRDRAAKTLSVHRLVQTQYRYYMIQEDKQRAFECAARLLFDAFPKSRNQLYREWARCQQHLQHTLALMENYKTSVPELQPTLCFCWLLSNCARYLLEASDYNGLGNTVSVAEYAYVRLPPDQQDLGLHCQLLSHRAIYCAHQGYFEQSYPKFTEIRHLYESQETINWLRLSWEYNNQALSASSLGNHTEGVQLIEHGLELRRDHLGDDKDVEKGNCVLLKNLGRCYGYLGNYDEAEKKFALAIQQATAFDNWSPLSSAHFFRGCLQRERGDLLDAMESIRLARNMFLERAKMPTHHLNGAYLYKLGCLEDDLGNTERAIDLLRESLTIAQMKESIMKGDYARVLHKLAEVLKKQMGGELEASEKHAEAESIRSQMCSERGLGIGPGQPQKESEDQSSPYLLVPSMTEVSISSEDAGLSAPTLTGIKGEKPYDALVYLLWR